MKKKSIRDNSSWEVERGIPRRLRNNNLSHTQTDRLADNVHTPTKGTDNGHT